MAKSAGITMTGTRACIDKQTVDLSASMLKKLWDLDGTMAGTPGHITIPVGGPYHVAAYLTIQADNPDSVKNGYSYVAVVDQAGQNHAQSSNWISPNFSTANLSDVVKLSAGQVLHLTVQNKLGQNCVVIGWFSATLIA